MGHRLSLEAAVSSRLNLSRYLTREAYCCLMMIKVAERHPPFCRDGKLLRLLSCTEPSAMTRRLGTGRRRWMVDGGGPHHEHPLNEVGLADI